MDAVPPKTLALCPDIDFIGKLWRMHADHLQPDSFDGYKYAAARMHVLGEGRTAYLSTEPLISIVESIRHFEAQEVDYSGVASVTDILDRHCRGLRAYLETRLLTVFDAALTRVKDCRDLSVLGISEEEFLRNRRDVDWLRGGHISQSLGHSLRVAGYEGVLVPSATKLGLNLIGFPDNLLPGSTLRPRKSGNPLFYPDHW